MKRQIPAGLTSVRRFAVMCAIGISFCCVMVNHASASMTLFPEATIQVGITGQDGLDVYTNPGTYSATSYGAGNTVVANGSAYFYGATATVAVSGSDSGPSGAYPQQATAGATVKYNIEVIGPSGYTVPLIFQAVGSASASADAASTAVVEMAPYGLTNYNVLFIAQAQGANYYLKTEPSSASFNGQVTGSLASNTLETVTVRASGSAPDLAAGAFSASVDPAVYIDPSYANYDLFTLEISPDLTPAPPAAAPIPAAAWLFGPGFAGLVALRRKFKN